MGRDGQRGEGVNARDVGLTEEEYRVFTEALGRTPNDLELGLAGVLWSEHCSYKSSKNILAWLPAPTEQEGMVGENAGVVPLDEQWEVAFKVESHNHPSFVEPFQGAATGVGGIIRDVLAMGAEPIALLDSLRFGRGPERDRVEPRVVEGIAFYGNAIGVPTVGGEVAYGDGYEVNPLVNVMCAGLRPRNRRVTAAARHPGDRVLLLGARTGRDGIHGASLLASREFDDDAHLLRPQVQVGDPFLGKLLIEGVLSALETGRVAAVQDCGAAGLSSASAEMAGHGGSGIRIAVDRVPVRETGMSPYEIMLSESQERMILVVPEDGVDEVQRAVARLGLEAVDIGDVTPSGCLEVMQGEEVLASVPAGILTSGCPRRNPGPRTFPAPAERPISVPSGMPSAVEALAVLGHPECRSRQAIYRQYDYMVKTSTVVPPGSDAAVLRIRGSRVGLALTTDGQARWGARDPFAGGARAVLEAVTNLTVSGAQALGLSDGLNAGSPDDGVVFGQFQALVAGIAEAARALEVPVTGGNVSFYNQTGGRGIWPTVVIGAVGRHPEPLQPTPVGPPESGLSLYALGPSDPDLNATVWRLQHGDGDVGLAARPDWDAARATLAAIASGHRQGLIQAAHDVSDGGLLVTLAEMALAAGSGLQLVVDLPADVAPRLWLFNEAVGQVVVAVREADGRAWESLLGESRASWRKLGRVRGDGEPGLVLVYKEQRLELGRDLLGGAWLGGESDAR